MGRGRGKEGVVAAAAEKKRSNVSRPEHLCEAFLQAKATEAAGHSLQIGFRVERWVYTYTYIYICCPPMYLLYLVWKPYYMIISDVYHEHKVENMPTLFPYIYQIWVLCMQTK